MSEYWLAALAVGLIALAMLELARVRVLANLGWGLLLVPSAALVAYQIGMAAGPDGRPVEPSAAPAIAGTSSTSGHELQRLGAEVSRLTRRTTELERALAVEQAATTALKAAFAKAEADKAASDKVKTALTAEVERSRIALAAAEARFVTERDAHVRTRAEELATPMAAPIAAAPSEAKPVSPSAPQHVAPTPAQAPVPSPMAAPPVGIAAGLPNAGSQAKPGDEALAPLSFPAPFSNTSPKPTPQVRVASADPEQGVQARLKSGRIETPAYVLAPRREGAVIAGRKDECYRAELRDQTTGRPFTFEPERYVLSAKDQSARDSAARLLADTVSGLPSTTTPRLYLASGASTKAFTRQRRLAVGRKGQPSVSYLPGERGSSVFSAKARQQTIAREYLPQHLPLLRAAAVRDVLANVPNVPQIDLLEGALWPETDPRAHTFEMFLCIGRP